MNRGRLGGGQRPQRVGSKLGNREGQSTAKSFAIEIEIRGAHKIVRYDARDQFAPETRLDLSLNRRSVRFDPSEADFSTVGSPGNVDPAMFHRKSSVLRRIGGQLV